MSSKDQKQTSVKPSQQNSNSKANVLIIHKLISEGNEMFEVTMSLPFICHSTTTEKDEKKPSRTP
jgi:hypothetical protein